MPTIEHEHFTGTITAVEDHGTIILVDLQTDKGRTLPIYFDHRPFGWLLDSERCRPADLLGRPVSYDGTTVAFLDCEDYQ